MNRQQHLEWCKTRALEYLDRGDITGAYSSFISDMNKHDELKEHSALQLGMMLILGGHLSTFTAMKEFIEGFN